MKLIRYRRSGNIRWILSIGRLQIIRLSHGVLVIRKPKGS